MPGRTIDQLPPGQPVRRFKPLEIVSADQIEAIHLASLEVLRDPGIDILNAEARRIFKCAGARVDGMRVYIGEEIIEHALTTVPSSFTFHARNRAQSVIIGGDHIMFAPVGGPPNCSDLDNGRRPGTLADSENFMRLAQHFNCIHKAGGFCVDALDVHASVRHLHVQRSAIKLSDKTMFTFCTGRQRMEDGLEMARIARGISLEQMDNEPSTSTMCNTNSPMKIDEFMAMGIIDMSRRNQVVCVTPFTLAGAMAPVTVAGALVQQNAEALAGLALGQLARAGAPFIYGGFTSNVDMKSGAPAFGTPEYMKAAVIGGQLARRYNVPYRTSASCAANAVDAQAAYETVFALWGAIMGGGNLILHSAGWMEGGLVASYEKFMLDVDLLQMVIEFLKPLETSDDALGLDAIREVGPGGHFFGARHTLERYKNAFYAPIISDWRNFEQWTAAGSPQAWQRANQLWKQALSEYVPPALDPAIAEELDAYVIRRVEQGGQPTDF